jgi:hypothetical protein
LSSSAKAGDPVFQSPVSEPRGRCVLDTPLSCLVPGDRFVAFVPRNDVIPIAGTSPRSRGAICPSCCMSHPRKQRAQGKPGARCTRSLVCSVLVAHECSHYRFTGTPSFPCAMVLTACFVLSPVTGLSCHRHLADNSAKLDASVGASGPHDFAVRISIIRPALACLMLPRPPHPVPYVRDDHDTPLCVGRDGGVLELIWVR